MQTRYKSNAGDYRWQDIKATVNIIIISHRNFSPFLHGLENYTLNPTKKNYILKPQLALLEYLQLKNPICVFNSLLMGPKMIYKI